MLFNATTIKGCRPWWRRTWPAAFLCEGAVRQQLQSNGVPLVRAAPSRGVRHHREADLAAQLFRSIETVGIHHTTGWV